ncbi:MAG: hypothetical protein RIR01_1452 [Bacteroidota bacterium]|jgi:hypothetical protein
MHNYKLLQDYNENGIVLKKGEYAKSHLISLYGSEDKFNFCLQCTSLKDVLIETPEDNIVIETPEQDLNIETIENKVEIETPEDKLVVENKELKSKNKKNK